jgi:hypothetical protein
VIRSSADSKRDVQNNYADLRHDRIPNPHEEALRRSRGPVGSPDASVQKVTIDAKREPWAGSFHVIKVEIDVL